MNNITKHFSRFYKLSSSRFSQIVPTSEKRALNKQEFLSKLQRKSANVSVELQNRAVQTGTDMFLKPESKKTFSEAGVDLFLTNPSLSKSAISGEKGWKLTYLKNMNLLDAYDNLFREYIQAVALHNKDALDLAAESRFSDYSWSKLSSIRKKGYFIEVDNLTINQDYEIINFELFKNLRVNRYANNYLSAYDTINRYHPVAKCLEFLEKNTDTNYIDKPNYIFATTMLVKSPMRLVIFNQNMTRPIFRNTNETVEYLVRFETELKAADFLSILPSVNKPCYKRATKVTDFNNVARGNPLFTESFDIHPASKRSEYLTPNEEEDLRLASTFQSLKFNSKLRNI